MNNNPFEAHGVDHLSPSSINQFISSPCHWLMKVAGHKTQTNPAMWRGTAVDEGVCHTIFDDTSLEDKQSTSRMIALQAFEREQKFSSFQDEDKATKEYDSLIDYVNVAVLCYNNVGKKPEAVQKKVELQFEELPIPIIGYIDVSYDDHIRDIKTVGRAVNVVPSNISRQLSVYAHAEKKPAFADFVNVTKTKGSYVDTHEITDVEKHIGVVKKVAYAMMNMLSYSNDIRTVASLLYPDFEHWMWSDHDKEFATKLWNI